MPNLAVPVGLYCRMYGYLRRTAIWTIYVGSGESWTWNVVAMGGQTFERAQGRSFRKHIDVPTCVKALMRSIQSP